VRTLHAVYNRLAIDSFIYENVILAIRGPVAQLGRAIDS